MPPRDPPRASARDRRSISYDQFTQPAPRQWPRLMLYFGVPLALAGALAGAAYVKLHGRGPEALDTTPPAALAKAGGPVQNETYQWKRVAIGGGGFIADVSIDASGKTMVARTDVYGAYIWSDKDNRWHQLVTATAMPQDLRTQSGAAQGVYEITVAPSDPNRIYMATKYTVYRSDDRGRTFTAPQSGPFPTWWDANSEWRFAGPHIAVDPTNPDLVLLGTPGQGVLRSSDGGRNWQRVASVPAGKDRVPQQEGVQGPGSQVWFEPGRDGKPTGRVLAFAPGTGMFVSADRGGSFRPLGASGAQPTTLNRGAFARNGDFFAVDLDGKTVWTYREGRWHDLVQEGKLSAMTYQSLATDPRSDRVLVLDQGGNGFLSPDGGRTWSNVTHSARVGEGDPPWLKVADIPYFATGSIQFDPARPDRIWAAHGVGVFHADLSGGDTHLAWVSQARGIEELVANDVVQPPGHAPLFAAWDFGIHIKHDLNAFSTRFAPDRGFIAVQQVDWTPAKAGFLVTNASDTRPCCAEDGNAVMAGYSTDGGSTWTKFPTLPTPPGTRGDDPWRMAFGTIAVSSGDPDNIVWEPAQNRAPFFTKDRGQTWEQVVLPGAVGDAYGSFQNNWYQRKTLTADKTTGGVFYLYHSGEAPNAGLAGLWRTADGGAGWERVFAGEIDRDSSIAAKLRSVPGKAGHLFFTSGIVHQAAPLKRSTDGGRTWASVGTVTHVDDVAFGKAARGANYPAIYISGRVGGVYGIWRSTDDAASWQKLVDFPMGTLDQVSVIGADPDVFGRVYLGYLGSGWIWGEPAPCRAAPLATFATSQCSTLGQ
ncbi:photosystem II stability/assembly factor-like uncharacterized protein [Novosphingobium chloroacetimidivorans]|uniref:Photosystem II stability/assembly factor-like uncharacterized protein n=1 Tax=Novosphingobium chloroacetimidivorans TaxID=1428314 RepID=A0A7W7K7C9_9SPHN|nr:sialidase family protein [Novosphingobium chloroacetimidivorans]MBB4857251.1 photosystem II stability/assembly factor-like uncharacterized protein [Novosphingobium chloroacetimidivorans]